MNILRWKPCESLEIVQREAYDDDKSAPSEVSDEKVQENDLLRDAEEVQASTQVNVEGCIPNDVTKEEISEHQAYSSLSFPVSSVD